MSPQKGCGGERERERRWKSHSFYNLNLRAVFYPWAVIH